MKKPKYKMATIILPDSFKPDLSKEPWKSIGESWQKQYLDLEDEAILKSIKHTKNK